MSHTVNSSLENTVWDANFYSRSGINDLKAISGLWVSLD